MDAPPNIATFEEWVKANHSFTHNFSDDISVDTLLDREMKGYADYLLYVRSSTEEKLDSLGGYVNERRDFYDDILILAIETARSGFKAFTREATEIRNRPYNFEPSDPAVPSFLEFCSENFPNRDAIPVYQRFIMYDSYATMIKKVAGNTSPRIFAAYDISRERRTEADRRELFGLSREPDTEALQQLNGLRDQVREVILHLEEDTDLSYDHADRLIILFYRQIQNMRRLIAAEVGLSEDQEAQSRALLTKARQAIGGDVADLIPYVQTLGLENDS
ncbi:hypothetical protein DL98DRAFT_593453 [Cadophora sp. DSE1049]|nr:hypothetical protein DL98DRAFT_593453 [Cadophora sp. DSE1049]